MAVPLEDGVSFSPSKNAGQDDAMYSFHFSPLASLDAAIFSGKFSFGFDLLINSNLFSNF